MASNHGTLYITGHDDKNEAIIHSEDPLQWNPADPSGNILVAKVFSTGEFPAQLSDTSDIQKHKERLASGDNSIGLKEGITSHFCLFGPGATFPIHRTVTLDYGVMLEGSLEMPLDSGESRTINAGDVVVQRGTMHGWTNPSKDKWAKILFVVIHAAPIKIGDAELGDDFSRVA